MAKNQTLDERPPYGETRFTRSASFGHAVGTCKMGVDNLAVVAFSRAKQGRLDVVKKLAGIEPMRTLEIAPLPWLPRRWQDLLDSH